MSGIFGIWHLDGAPAHTRDLEQMAAVLAHRGPDGIGTWHTGPVGIGHVLLGSTPESLFERQPLHHAASGCVITADVRLDNRFELLADLNLRERAPRIGDAEIILMAYLRWGAACVSRLLGDFAFAIWDPRDQQLFCARDQFGMRPFYYHHTPNFFAFASEPRAILVQQRTPYRINEAWIAAGLITEMGACDNTSSYFEEVYRLPPAHLLIVSRKGAKIERYWRLEPQPELKLPSDEAYSEAFLEIFASAVKCRLRSVGPVGSMLSGGLDSGSVVAVARTLLTEAGNGPLHTFSATAPDPSTCVETRTIQAALTMDGLCAHTVHFDELKKLMPALEDLTWNYSEPFDSAMTLVRAVYLLARQQGIKVVLDGVAGDIMFNEGAQLARLWRAGHWVTAVREAAGESRFYGVSPFRKLYKSARSAMTPNWVRIILRRAYNKKQLQAAIRGSMINRDFADRIGVQKLWALKHSQRSIGILRDQSLEHAQSIDHPDLVHGREVYNRYASSVGIEPRDPFMDRRLVNFCLSLPGNQKLGGGGWPKIILRRAMANHLPDAVRWRLGKEHLGWSFTVKMTEHLRERMLDNLDNNFKFMAPYIDEAQYREWHLQFHRGIDSDCNGTAYLLNLMCYWLGANVKRPQLTARFDRV